MNDSAVAQSLLVEKQPTIPYGIEIAKEATLNRIRHYIICGHVKMSPRATIATATSASMGRALFGYNLNSEASVIAI